MTYYYIHEFLNRQSIGFFYNPLNTSSQYHSPKFINSNLAKILLNPERYKALHPSQVGKKIFLGFGAVKPFSAYRSPIWIEPEILFSHILIGGSIGSGKSTLITRLLAGSLNCGLTAVIGEAKGSLEVNPKRTAFSRLALYLSRRLNVKSYRWPRGNCYFNPLLYLNNLSERRTFMQSIARQIKAEGDIKAYINRSADIAAYILELLETISVGQKQAREKLCTLRSLVELLKKPEKLEKVVEKALQDFSSNSIKAKVQKIYAKIQDIYTEIERLNFLKLKTPEGREKFVMGAGGINFFIEMLNEEDLLFYSEPHTQDRHGNQLIKLELDDIVYNQALVVISQPLASNHPSADIVGPIFWDALLNHNLRLGLTPTPKNGHEKRDIVAFLDETHRLPTGRMGNSGDFLREYRIGLVEITPTVVDKERWEQNKHVYQTIISTSPGVPEVCHLIHDRLPEKDQERFEIGIDLRLDAQGRISVNPKLIDNCEQNSGDGDPGVSARSLRSTGKYTALLYTDTLRDAGGIFWIDLESTILSKLNNFLEDANAGDRAAAKVIDYALGINTGFDSFDGT